MSPLPADMIDRWRNRVEPQPGEGTIYWHMLVGRYPQVRALAREAQNRLAPFSGLHFTPAKWLHMTALVVGSADRKSLDQTQALLTEASRLLIDVPPVTVTLGRVLYHPQAIMVGVESSERLRPIRDAVEAVTREVSGREGYTEGPATWTPHLTVAYSTADQPAAPLIDTLGKQLAPCEVAIDSVSLVIQHGPERLWDWQPVGAALLLGESSEAEQGTDPARYPADGTPWPPSTPTPRRRGDLPP